MLQIIEELKKLNSIAIYQRTKDLLNKEILKIETELVASTKEAVESKSSVKTSSTRVFAELSEHAFDESDKYVKIYIPFNATPISDDNVQLELTENSFCLNIQGDSKTYRFNVRNLLKPIDIAKSYKKVKSDMVSVYLKKKKEGKFDYLSRFENIFLVLTYFPSQGINGIT